MKIERRVLQQENFLSENTSIAVEKESEYKIHPLYVNNKKQNNADELECKNAEEKLFTCPPGCHK